MDRIKNIYNTFKKYSFYKNKLEKYLNSNKIYFMLLKNDINDNYNKLIIGTKKRSKSLFLPMVHQFYIMMCLLKESSDIFKFFKSVNLDNLKKLLKESDNLHNHEELLNEYFSIVYKYRKHISHRFLNEDIFIFHVKGLKYKYYNKSNADFKTNTCIDNNCQYIDAVQQYKLDFYMENDIKKRLEILNNFFISAVFKKYYSCIYNNCYKESLLSLKTNIIYLYTIYCLKIDCNNKHINNYNSLMNSFKTSNYTLNEFIDLNKKCWKFAAIILVK